MRILKKLLKLLAKVLLNLAEEEPHDTLCLIYGDTAWDITSTENIRRLIAQFKTARRAGNMPLAWKHLVATRPECVRLASHTELDVMTHFESYKTARVERRYTARVFNGIDVRKIKHIIVYTMPPQRSGNLHKHCELTRVIWE